MDRLRPQGNETFSPGDRVQFDYGGKLGDTGTVAVVYPRRLKTGGSAARVRVVWDDGHEGMVEQPVLVLLPHEPQDGPGLRIPPTGKSLRTIRSELRRAQKKGDKALEALCKQAIKGDSSAFDKILKRMFDREFSG